MRRYKFLRNQLTDAKGYTLVEMVVSFALTGILMVTAAAVLPVFIGNNARVRSVANAQNVADILLEKIGLQMEGASRKEFVLCNSNQISFYNENDVRVTIGLLGDIAGPDTLAKLSSQDLPPAMIAMRYETIQIEKDGNVRIKGTDWYYGKDIYQGNEVKELQFVWKGKNLVKVELTLVNPKTGYELAASRMVECFRLNEIQMEEFDAEDTTGRIEV